MSEKPHSAQDICAALEIEIVPTSVRRSTLGRTQTCAGATIEALIASHGVGHTVFVRRTITETVDNGSELVAPTITAVSKIAFAHPEWVEKGLAWFDAFDEIDLPMIRQRARRNLRAVPVAEAMAAMIFERLFDRFEAPIDLNRTARGLKKDNRHRRSELSSSALPVPTMATDV